MQCICYLLVSDVHSLFAGLLYVCDEIWGFHYVVRTNVRGLAPAIAWFNHISEKKEL